MYAKHRALQFNSRFTVFLQSTQFFLKLVLNIEKISNDNEGETNSCPRNTFSAKIHFSSQSIKNAKKKNCLVCYRNLFLTCFLTLY